MKERDYKSSASVFSCFVVILSWSFNGYLSIKILIEASAVSKTPSTLAYLHFGSPSTEMSIEKECADGMKANKLKKHLKAVPEKYIDILGEFFPEKLRPFKKQKWNIYKDFTVNETALLFRSQ